jgi:Motility quorum-sensing regulator, toxin of MqsA
VRYYSLSDIQALVRAGDWEPANERVNRTLEKLAWQNETLAELIACLTHRDFQKCVPNCKSWVGLRNCDQYAICWDEEQLCRASDGLEFFLKLAIAKRSTDYVAVVGFHLSGEP